MNMKNDDQWFREGDKVMKVACRNNPQGFHSPHLILTEFGMVYSVKECHQFSSDEFPPDGINGIVFVGENPPRLPDGLPLNFHFASNYRKVSEIKLCIAAVSKKEEPVET